MLHAMNMLTMACMVEPILWLVVLFSYSRIAPSYKSRPFFFYLATQLVVSVISVPIVYLLLTSTGTGTAGIIVVYTQIYWLGLIASGVLAIATLREILGRLLSPLVSLQRIALIIFQWILVIATFVILSRMAGEVGQLPLRGELATLAEGVNLTQLVLLVPLLPFTFSVQRTLRSHIQDIMMGLAMLAASSSVLNLSYHARGELSSAAAVVSGHIILIATLIFWSRCLVVQGRREVPLTISIDSKLVRLGEKLRALDQASAGQGK